MNLNWIQAQQDLLYQTAKEQETGMLLIYEHTETLTTVAGTRTIGVTFHIQHGANTQVNSAEKGNGYIR